MQSLNGPIPGQSLTTEPKGYPWERPPEIVDPEKAMQVHLSRLSDPDLLEDALNLIEFEGIDIQTLVMGLMRSAVANGIHSIDVALIIAPVIHEFIKQAAKAVGVDADDGFEDLEGKEEKEQDAIASRARKTLEKMKVKPKEVAKEVKMEEMPEEPAPAERKGLMSREMM